MTDKALATGQMSEPVDAPRQPGQDGRGRLIPMDGNGTDKTSDAALPRCATASSRPRSAPSAASRPT